MTAVIVIRRAVPRPPFTLGGSISWAAFPIIHAILRRTCAIGEPYPDWVVALPNRLTKLRLLLVPLPWLFAWMAISGHPYLAGMFFSMMVALLLGDGFDGAIARYIDHTTTWGEVADPVFDKIAALSMYSAWILMVTLTFPQFDWMIWVVILRLIEDFALSMIALVKYRRKLGPKAYLSGKIKAALDFLALGLGYFGILLFPNGQSWELTVAGIGLLILAAGIFAPLSIYEHLLAFRRLRSVEPK